MHVHMANCLLVIRRIFPRVPVPDRRCCCNELINSTDCSYLELFSPETTSVQEQANLADQIARTQIHLRMSNDGVAVICQRPSLSTQNSELVSHHHNDAMVQDPGPCNRFLDRGLRPIPSARGS